ncbi:MAG TPA: radical SAM family heme chaperone HemW [Thermoanaerobaculia bacterium]|jgi:oxygen-independent coproporphyrinogen-3 oxidase
MNATGAIGGSAAGLYVHLPYCASRCGYCAFVVTTDDSSRERYLAALDREAGMLAVEAAGSAFDAIYLGGGTPSLLPPAAVSRLLASLRERFELRAGAEVTLEANPEDVSAAAVAAWVEAGVTRISVGVQSLEDAELAAVGRRHDARRAAAALETLVRAGVAVSGDLILGLPLQTEDSFARSLEGLCDAGVSHVSVYLLEAEKSRTIEEDRRTHPERYLGDDPQADAWLAMGQTLASRGFRHYEISNWARPGREARHNVKYWTRTPTLGLGVSAHELWAGRRRANVSQLPAYLERLESGRRPIALDQAVTEEEAARERVYLGLRLAEGVPADAFEEQLGRTGDPRLREDYDGWLKEGILRHEGGRIRFTERGFLVSNEVLSRFV